MTTIKVKCNGPGQHINEISVDELERREFVTRATVPPANPGPAAPEWQDRYVFNCRCCAEGTVVITRAMLHSLGL